MNLKKKKKKVERNAVYFFSNTDRLLGDHMAWSDGNSVDELCAYFFDSRLHSSLMEVRRKLAAHTPSSIVYSLLIQLNKQTRRRRTRAHLPHHWVSDGLCLSLRRDFFCQPQAKCSSCGKSFEPYMGRAAQTRSPSWVNDKTVCKWSLLEISNQLLGAAITYNF